MAGSRSPVTPEEKPASYYAQERADLVAELPQPLGSVLDVGCGSGGAAGPLRAAGAERLTGIEIHAPSAEAARAVYDQVLAGRAEDVVSSLTGPYDTILCYDSLEHLADPASLVGALQAVAAPGARLHLSIPNARHFSLVRDLVFRGTFGYTGWGHRDSTHLRWFTRRDIVALLEGTGWRVERVSHARLRASSRALARVTRGLSAEFLVHQWWVLARRRG